MEAWCSDNYWLLAASGLVIPATVGFAFGGKDEALMCFLWAGCMRVALLHQITWSVNSFGHMIGSKVIGSRDEARDNRLLAILLIGEGLHSFHHKNPLAAVNEPAGIDASGQVLKLLAKLGAVDFGGARQAEGA
jgi:stearoyl-CoA desaturase (delta-9 desaturase)